MHNTGDTAVLNDMHDGLTNDKYVTLIAGANPAQPPCFHGKPVGVMVKKGLGKPAFAKGGAPTTDEMAR